MKNVLLKPFEIFNAGEMEVIPLLADHCPEVLIYIFQINGKSILYGNDSDWFPEKTWEKLAEYKFDIVIMDCTNGPLPIEDISHMEIAGILKAKGLIQKIGIVNSNNNFIATHFSHNEGLLHDELCSNLNPEGVSVAYGGMRIEIKD